MQNQIVLIKKCAESLLSKNYYTSYEQLRFLLFVFLSPETFGDVAGMV